MDLNFNTADKSVILSINQDVRVKDFDEVFQLAKSVPHIDSVKVDLKELFYIKSDILAQLLALKRLATEKKARMTLLNVNEGVYHVLEVSNLLQLFHIQQDYGRYRVTELIEMFHSPEYADEISEYLASVYSDEYKAVLSAASSAEDSIIREYAILTMGRAHDFDSVDLIREGLSSGYPNVVSAAILVLGWMGDFESKEKFYDFLISSDESVAEAAGASIALLGDDSDPRRLAALAQNGSPQVRIIVAGILSLINGDEAYGVLKTMLEREEAEEVRRVIVRRISFFNKNDAVETLIGALNDPRRSVQEAAAAGLERTGLRGHEPEVLQKVSGEDRWVAYFSVKALGRQCSKESSTYLQKIYSTLNENVRLAVLEVLGLCGDTEEFLAARLTDENEDIRKEALSSLYRVNAGRGLKEAEYMAVHDASWLVRFRAVEIIAEERSDGYKKVLENIKNIDSNRYIQEKINSILDHESC